MRGSQATLNVSRSAALADAVVDALIAEVMLSPKPGLVDLRSRGAHHDLDWTLMCRSASALHATFEAMAQAGAAEPDAGRSGNSVAGLHSLRERIGQLGRIGEVRMMRATGGVNTHRGAIWALGLLVTSAAQCGRGASVAVVMAQAGKLARCPDRYAPVRTGNKGEQACQVYRVGGARGQAQAGFPHIRNHALPWLRRSRLGGCADDEARLNALLAVMAHLDDTCVLARGGPSALHTVQAGAAGILQAGGVQGGEGRRALHRFEQQLLARNLSPGGAADLLAATLFLDGLLRAEVVAQVGSTLTMSE